MERQDQIKMDKISIKNFFLKYNIVIPEFQRRLVWNDSKKLDLIDSLTNGFPIGAITLFEDDNSYLLVDGLQRVNTMLSYFSNPSKIKTLKFYKKEINNDILNFIEFYNKEKKDKITISKLDKVIKGWYESLDSNYNGELNYSFEDFNLLKDALEKESVLIYTDFSMFQKFRSILLKPIDVFDAELVIITYQGSRDNLPLIFSKINKKNISLTGYEILHSLWHKLVINSTRSTKYLESFKKIENVDFIKTKDIKEIPFNMYVNLTGLGNLVFKNDEKFDKIFSINQKSFIEKNELVFDIFSTIFKGTTNQIDKCVQEIFELDLDKDEFLMDLNEAIEDCALFLNNYLIDKEINFIYSKYFYIYLFYFVFYNNYMIEKYTLIKLNEEISLENFPDCDGIKKENWFKDENRQLTFFVKKIELLSQKFKINYKSIC